jgi:hypothetical protein
MMSAKLVFLVHKAPGLTDSKMRSRVKRFYMFLRYECKLKFNIYRESCNTKVKNKYSCNISWQLLLWLLIEQVTKISYQALKGNYLKCFTWREYY